MIQLFEHNQIAYEAVCEQLVDTGKAYVVNPTGTGKSFMAFKWMGDHPERRFLWLSPSETIFATQLENVYRASGFKPDKTGRHMF
jgi:superfamily II DNA or RNA helicase